MLYIYTWQQTTDIFYNNLLLIEKTFLQPCLHCNLMQLLSVFFPPRFSPSVQKEGESLQGKKFALSVLLWSNQADALLSFFGNYENCEQNVVVFS